GPLNLRSTDLVPLAQPRRLPAGQVAEHRFGRLAESKRSRQLSEQGGVVFERDAHLLRGGLLRIAAVGHLNLQLVLAQFECQWRSPFHHAVLVDRRPRGDLACQGELQGLVIPVWVVRLDLKAERTAREALECCDRQALQFSDRKSTRLNSSHVKISY